MTASEALAIAAVPVAGSLAAVLNYAQASNFVLVRGQGKVVPLIPHERLQTVNSSVKGVVRHISKSLVAGGMVKRDEILMEIEPYAADLVAQLQAQAEDLKNKLAADKSIAKLYDENIIALELAKDAALDAADTLIDTAKAKSDAQERRVAGLEAKELQSRMNFERQKTLLIESGIGTSAQVEKLQQDWDVTTAELESAKLEVQTARQEWESMKSKRIEKEREAQTKITSSLAIQQNALEQVAILEKKIQDTNVKLSRVERLLIKAPSDGVLVQSNVHQRGQVLKEGDELFTIGPHAWESAVELWVSGNDAPLVQRGDRVRLEFEGWPALEPADFFGGEVLSLAPVDDGSGKFRVPIKEDGNNSWPDDRYLRPGVRANGWVITGSR